MSTKNLLYLAAGVVGFILLKHLFKKKNAASSAAGGNYLALRQPMTKKDAADLNSVVQSSSEDYA